MLVGNLAIAMNLLSIAVLAFAISVGLLAILSALIISRFKQLTFPIRKVILWSFVTAPWWIAASCIGFFWPRQQDIFPTAWLNNFAHWHHVDVFYFTSWHAVTLFSACIYLLCLLARAIYVHRKQLCAMSDLIQLSDIQQQETQQKQRYYSLSLNVPTAFTSGLFIPKIYLTTALQKRVSAQELDIIVKHEMAHVRARDPLFKLVFALCAGFYPSLVRRKLLQQFTLLTEQLADSAVAQEYDQLDVAQTLINVTRMQRNLSSGVAGLCTSFFGNDQTSIRVQQLISPVLSSSKLAVSLAILMFISAPFLTASTVDSLHHFIETFFTH
jgi:beta-lactamase regulating signal transducer with metallopeptidase domain